MSTRKFISFSLMMVMALILSACGAQATATPVPTLALPPSVPPAATPTVEPTATFEPEIQANTAEAILGTWNLGTKGTSGMAIDYLIFFDNSSYSWEVGQPLDKKFRKGQQTDVGKFSFEGNQLKLVSSKGCFDRDLNNFPCVGIYEVFITMQAGKPFALRLVKVDDDHYYRAYLFPGLHTIVIEP
jgi:hypothetical protein